MEKPILTIGIPTYNRIEAIKYNIKRLIEEGLPNNIEILILDNNSEDNTYNYLKEKYSNLNNFIVVKNSNNIGYGRNFLKLFEKIDSKYILVTSDEDIVIVKKLDEYLDFLDKFDPDLAVPKVILDRGNGLKLYRGENSIKKIEPMNIVKSTRYISGLTYKISGNEEKIRYLNSKIGKYQFLQIYPQTVLAILLGNMGRLFYYNQEITKKEFHLKNNICSDEGTPFNFVNSRWEQIKSFYDFINELSSLEENKEILKYYHDIKESYLSKALSYIKAGIIQERPSFKEYIDTPKKRFLNIKKV